MKSNRERQIYDTTYLWTLKNDTNELIYKLDRFTDIGDNLMVTKEDSRVRRKTN